MAQPNTAYQNEYRKTLWDDDEQQDTEATPGENPEDKTEATSQPDPELSPEEKTYKQRYDSLKAHYDRQILETRKKIDELTNQLHKSKDIPLPKTPEEIQAWRKEFPDVYDMVKTIARMEATSERKEIDQKLEYLAVESKQAKRARAEAILLRYHPDFEDLRNDQAFHDWVKEQPAPIQAWLYENEDDPLLAAKAIDLYKMEKGIGKKKVSTKKEESLAASKSVTRTAQAPPDRTEDGKKIWKTSDIRKMTPRQFEKLEEEIDKAIEEGRVIDDM